MPRQLYLINFVIAVCVGYGLTLVGSVCPAVAQTAPLQVTLTTNKSQYSLNDPIVVTIRLKNVSSSDVVIPKIEPINDGVYVLVDVQHESGVTVFFLDPFNEKPLARAATTEVLPAGAERVFVETLNGGGVGPLGSPQPTTVTLMSGTLQVTATFVVNLENLPDGGDPAVFQGTVSSTDTAPATSLSMTETVDTDGDGDGIADDVETCSSSDLRPTVIIDDCDSGVGNTLFVDNETFGNGCTISNLIAKCAEGVSSHDEFVSCVAGLTNDLLEAGSITGMEKGAIQSCAAQANIP